MCRGFSSLTIRSYFMVAGLHFRVQHGFMIILPQKILNNRQKNKAAFSMQLKAALENLGLKELPLQQGLSASSVALDDELQVIILSVEEKQAHIEVHAGIFYSGVIAGCNCAGDPTPVDRVNEYCEIDIRIEADTGETAIRLSPG